jgi:cell division protein FtsW
LLKKDVAPTRADDLFTGFTGWKPVAPKEVMLMRKLNTTYLVFTITIILVGIGLVMVYSSSAPISAYQIRRSVQKDNPEQASEMNLYHDASYLQKQAIWASLGLVAMLLLYYSDYQKLKEYGTWLMLVALLLLILVLIPRIGVMVNGARRWLRLGSFTLQPSEFAKLALIIYMAKLLSEKDRQEIRTFLKGFLPALTVLAMFLILVILEPDFGTAVILGGIVFVIWYIGGMRLLHLSSLVAASVPCLFVAIVIKQYRIDRLLGFFCRDKDILGINYQLNQSLIAIGSGGLFGKGLGRGLQKYQFLTEAHTDFVFAIIGEELGFIGAALVVLLFFLLMIQGIRIAIKAPDYFGGMLAAGIITMIGLSAFINFLVVLGCMPTKGMTLPFISYGGSSLLVNMAAIGILLNISKYKEFVVYGNRQRDG